MVIRGKEGQQLSLTTIIVIILGLFVLVLLVLGVVNGFGFLDDIFNKAPSDLDQIRIACEQYSSDTFQSSFCEFREIDVPDPAIDGFYNCPGVWDVSNTLNPGSAGFDKGSCGAGSNGAIAYCNSLKEMGKNDWEKTIVNGIACGQTNGAASGWIPIEVVTCSTLRGEWQPGDCRDGFRPVGVPVSNQGEHLGEACCVPA